jgi:hypothetical protein
VTTSPEAPPKESLPSRRTVSSSRSYGSWFLGIVGGIATFVGLFILFAGPDQSVGIGGQWSWRVGDISTAWGYGLLGGGLVLLLITGALVASARRFEATRSGIATTNVVNLLWHAGIFLVVNVFLWVQDFAVGGGLDYAYWVTIPWGVGLLIHAGVVYGKRGQIESSSTGPSSG